MCDYSFYVTEYHGALSEAEFSRQAVPALAYLDMLTLGRINRPSPEHVQHKVKLALCAVVDVQAQQEAGEITSESNDGISVTYAKRDGTDGQRRFNAAALYLANTGLLYRGCCF